MSTPADEAERPGYFLLFRKVTDPEPAARYLEGAGPVTRQYGGEYLARGAVPEVLEGGLDGVTDDPGFAVVIVRFPSAAQARAFYHSEEYRPWREIAQQAFERHMLVLEGLPAV